MAINIESKKGKGKPIIDSPTAFQKAVNDAIDWKYLTVLKGGKAIKPELDDWLRSRYDIDAITARAISNDTDDKIYFSSGRDGIVWHEDRAGRPAPTFKDFPDLAPKVKSKIAKPKHIKRPTIKTPRIKKPKNVLRSKRSGKIFRTKMKGGTVLSRRPLRAQRR